MRIYLVIISCFLLSCSNNLEEKISDFDRTDSAILSIIKKYNLPFLYGDSTDIETIVPTVAYPIRKSIVFPNSITIEYRLHDSWTSSTHAELIVVRTKSSISIIPVYTKTKFENSIKQLGYSFTEPMEIELNKTWKMLKNEEELLSSASIVPDLFYSLLLVDLVLTENKIHYFYPIREICELAEYTNKVESIFKDTSSYNYDQISISKDDALRNIENIICENCFGLKSFVGNTKLYGRWPNSMLIKAEINEEGIFLKSINYELVSEFFF